MKTTTPKTRFWVQLSLAHVAKGPALYTGVLHMTETSTVVNMINIKIALEQS